MNKVSPDEYLRENDLDESLVIKMYHLQEKMEIHLIIDFARTPQLLKYLETGVRSSVPYPRDFRHLVFSGTSDISITDVQIKKPVDLLHYSVKGNPPLTLQFVELEQNGKNRISLYFGTDGTLRFTFDTLEVERKLGRGVKAGDDYDYFEVESGKKFDFYNPF
jgi:hypothetical protein